MASSQPFFPSPKPPDLPKTAASFASVVAAPTVILKPKPRFAPLALPARQVGQKEGKPSICFSGPEIGACEKRFEHSIVAKFTVGRPRLAEIQKAFQSSWATSGRVSISAVWDSRHLLVIFDSEEDVRAALASPLNKVGHALFRLFRWYPDYNPKRESAISTVWIRLPGLPISIYDSAFIEAIVSTFGYFVAVDARTKACTALNSARACVELDVTKEIPGAVWIGMPDNKSYWQVIEVESKIAFCSKCKIHGHKIESCRKRRGSHPTEGQVEKRASPRVANPTEEQLAASDASQVSKEHIQAPIHSGGEEHEWQVVGSRKQKNTVKAALQPSKVVENPAERVSDAPKSLFQRVTLATRPENALVVYRGKGTKEGQVDSQGKNVLKTRNNMSNVIPRDLSRAELRIRNKATNVLVFNDELGVLVNPNFLPHYNMIREKAGSTRAKPGDQKYDETDDEFVSQDPSEEDCSMGSKHCPKKVSQ